MEGDFAEEIASLTRILFRTIDKCLDASIIPTSVKLDVWKHHQSARMKIACLQFSPQLGDIEYELTRRLRTIY